MRVIDNFFKIHFLGSLFPPRDVTKSDIVYLYDKDLCRLWRMQYREDTMKQGIPVGVYTPADDMFTPEEYGNSSCFCGGFECPPRGLQSISPCQFGKHNHQLEQLFM